MRRVGDEALALVALQLARLRDAGWPAGRALSVIVDALPPGSARTEFEAVAAALQRGERHRPSGHPLLRLLARGEATDGASLRRVAQGLLDRWESTQVVRSVVAPVVAAVAVAALLAATLGWAVRLSGFADALWVGFIPHPTALSLAVFDFMRWAGLPLAVALLLLAGWFPVRWTPGARELADAAWLRLSDSDPDRSSADPFAGLKHVDVDERSLAAALMGRFGRPFAVEALATALEEVAARRQRFWAVQLPVATAILLVSVLAPLLLALYLPLLTVAGAIR